MIRQKVEKFIFPEFGEPAPDEPMPDEFIPDEPILDEPKQEPTKEMLFKAAEKTKIDDIKKRLSLGDELRDIARTYGMSCRAICRLVK